MSTIVAARIFSDIFTLGAAEIGWKRGEDVAKGMGLKGGLADVQAKADAALAMKDEPKGDVSKVSQAPDVTDDLVRRRRAAMASQLILGQGRKSSFASGDLGNLNLGAMSLTSGGNK